MIIFTIITFIDLLLAYILVKFFHENDFQIHKFAGYFLLSIVPILNIFTLFYLIWKIGKAIIKKLFNYQ